MSFEPHDYVRHILDETDYLIHTSRGVLIHGYFGVDYELVWEVVQTQIPQLRRTLEAILSD